MLELIDHIASLDEYTTEEIENQFVEAFRQSYTHPDQYPHAKIKQPQIWLENFCIIASHTLRNTLKNEISPSRMSSYSQKEIYIALLLHIWYGKAARLQANEIFPSHPETKKQISKKVLEIIEHMKQ